MGGTKFMVIKFKELLKTAIFAVLGVIIIIAIVYFMVPKNKTAMYKPGVYSSNIVIDDELIQVDVAVDEQEIKSVSLIHTSETLPVFYPLLEKTASTISDEIVAKQSLDVEIPPDASVTSQIILDAVEQSLEKAALD